MGENWMTSIVCFASSPIMAIPESSVLPDREYFQVPTSIPIIHPPTLQIPRFVTYGVITKKRTPRIRVDQIQELGNSIKISTTKKEEESEKKKVVKELRKPLPFDLNLLPDINEGEKVSRKRKKPTNSELQGTNKKTINKTYAKFFVPNPAYPLPNYVKEKIEDGGALEGDPVLVVQRIVNKTDLSLHHNRLGIPVRQVLCPGFLTGDEMQILLKKEGIKTDVIMPSLEKHEIILRRWPMGTKNCGIFVLSGSWNKSRKSEKMSSKKHRILLDTVLQVWAYRYRGNDNTVHFALVNVGWHPRNTAAEAKIVATVAAADEAAAAATAAANASAAAANAFAAAAAETHEY